MQMRVSHPETMMSIPVEQAETMAMDWSFELEAWLFSLIRIQSRFED